MTDESAHEEQLNVVIADDHPLFRDGLRALLAGDSALRIVGEATNGTDAVALAVQLMPDVVLMDLHMPGLSGIECTREIVAASPHIGVLVLTMFDDDDSIFAAMRAGARGYLLKDAGRPEILRAIRAVAGGQAIFGPAVAMRVIRYFGAARTRPGLTAFPQLTDRELEILDLIAAGMSNSEITRRLVISPKTVRNHVSNIFAKLQVADRAQAIVRAREAGMGTKDAAVQRGSEADVPPDRQ